MRAKSPIDASNGRPTGNLRRFVVILLCAAGLGSLVMAGVKIVRPNPALSASESAAMGSLISLGESIRDSIARAVRPAMNRTQLLARDPQILAALGAGEASRLTLACNNAIRNATEIDAVALFDANGRIVAINDVYADGRAIDPERVRRIMAMNFDGREIIGRCVRDSSDTPALQFQTDCDITPAYFDSSGLSVAYSVPVRDPATGQRVGVVSARLRFDRLTDVIDSLGVGGRPGSVQFLTDTGKYFAEGINAGREKPPIATADLSPIVAPIVAGHVDHCIVRHGTDYLALMRLSDFATLEGGGIQVLLIADEQWIGREVRQASMLSAGSFGLVGVSFLLVAMVVRGAEQRRQLHAARLQAERASQAKGDFLANMSHEIRTPMTAILGFTDILTDSESNPSDRLNAVHIIRRNGEHLLGVINDILDLSKIEAGRILIEHTDCNPCQVIADALDLFNERAVEKGLTLGLQIDSPIPDRIQSDALRLRQSLFNLVSNAVKFTEHGSVNIRASCDAQSGLLTLAVADTGPGIPSDLVEQIFQPFAQAEASTTRRFGGTGLGLSISRSLTRMLGGDLSVQSTPGKGSTFTLSVTTGPITNVRWADTVEKIRAHVVPPPPVTALPRLSGRILLVEDGPDNQRLLSTLLRKAGAEVTLAANGQQGVDIALAAVDSGDPFDVILMDMQMPVMDGYAATRELRRRDYRGPIISLTAYASRGEMDKCLAAGCDGYLSKPVSKATLLCTVAERLAAGPKHRESQPVA